MVFQSRTVRLTPAPAGGDQSQSESPAHDEGTQEDASLQNIVGHQHQQQVVLFREITGRLRRTRSDLARLSRLRETAEVRHPPPWSPELVGCEKLLTSEQAWREYERRYLRVAPSVQLPPPEEVNISLLTARLAGEQPMLPTPGRTCAQGFFPPQGRCGLAHNEPRLRCLVPGARLPNTVLIRLLWSTRTLLDVEYYRAMENRRVRRRQHWEYFEWSDSDAEEEAQRQEPAAYMSRLESVATRRRNRRKVSMVDHHHLENWLQIAASGVDDGAAPDSEDETISRLRQRRISRRGKLLSDIDGTPASEEDAYTPALGRFTCGSQSGEKKQRKKKPKIDASDKERRVRRRRAREKEEGVTGEEKLETIPSEYFDSDEEDYFDEYEESTEDADGEEQKQADDAEPGECEHDRAGGRRPSHRAATSPHGQQAGYSVSPVHTAEGHATTPGLHPSPGVPAGGQPGPTGTWSPSRWTGQTGQSPNRQQLGQPSRRAGSVSPSPSPRGRTSMATGGDKTVLNASRVRPDVDASISSVTPDPPPPRRHALRMPHLFEVKDYVCEESKVAGMGPTERGMTHLGVKHAVCSRRARSERSSESGRDASEFVPKAQKWSSSRIPGIFYDTGLEDEYEGDEESDTASRETDHRVSPHPRSGSPRWKPRSPIGTGSMRQLAMDYIKSLMQHEWARELLHGANEDSLDPWEAAERLVKKLPRQSFEIQQDILHEVRTIYETFPAPENLHPISTGILSGLSAATDDIVTLNMTMDTLVLLADQMDVVLANILTLLTMDRLDVRDCIQSLLERLGLVDPHHVLLTEVLSWVPRGKRRKQEALAKEINRKALSFVGNWMQAFEAHTKLIAEEVNQRKMDAVVKYNIIKILKNYEPLTIEETDDGFNVNLREPSSATRLKHPEVIEVLNYFVEMTDDEDELRQSRRESGRLSGRQGASDPLEWRRNNKDILVPPTPSPLVKGNRPLVAGVLQPTALVTHWHGVSGLAPGPWPTVTVGIRLRIADKYYRGMPAAGALIEFQ